MLTTRDEQARRLGTAAMVDDEYGDQLREAERIAGRLAPAYIVLDRRFRVQHFSEAAGRYVEPATGTASLDVLRLVHRDLAAPLHEALAQASATGATAVRGCLPLSTAGGSDRGVDLVVEPILPGTQSSSGYVVLLRDAVAAAPSGRTEPDNRVEQLERELQWTREDLETTIAQREVSNEELAATNEELAIANEELQTVNEELQAANRESEASRQELQDANGDLKNLLENTQIATVLLEEDLCVRAFTAAAMDVFHLALADVGRPLSHVAPRVVYPEMEGDIDQVLRSLATVEREVGSPQGRRFQVCVLPYRNLEGRIAGTVLTFLDVTGAAHAQAELAVAEATLRQSQKMEAVGQLTGGLAHDFNNMLQGIAGSLDMMHRRVEQGRAAEVGRFVESAREMVERAAALTHRLLAFARRQTLQPESLKPNTLVEGMAELIRRTTGPGVQVELRMGNGAWTVLCDPSQLENALLNLAINARDAMPDGGRLTIRTGEVCLSEADVAGQDEAVPGQYVEVSVADTGTGMDEAMRARVFEPFFTTKPLGQGTGLGLSQVYGFVRQSNGIVGLDSAPGRGTTVRMLLPRHEPADQVESQPAPEKAQAEAAGAGGVVFLVEDEELVRTTTAEHLRDLGYQVLEAADGAAVPRLLRSCGGRVDLLVTDVGLPGGMNGRQVADALRERHPGLPVLFITGYAGGALDGQLAPGMEVMGKPFALDALAAKVRGMIRRGERRGPNAEEAQHLTKRTGTGLAAEPEEPGSVPPGALAMPGWRGFPPS